MKKYKPAFAIVLTFLIILIVIYSFPLSSGDRYVARLQAWYSYAQSDDWIHADRLAVSLDKADIQSFQSQHHPNLLQDRVSALSQKNNKTIEDYLELAKVYFLLRQKDLSLQALETALGLDPIRDDIGNFIVDLKR